MTDRNFTRAPSKAQHNQKTLDFINKSRAIHGDKFSYEKTVYINSKTKIVVTCNECGSDCLVTNSNHIYNKTGCRYCRDQKSRLTQEQFIKRAKKVHGNKYDYSKTKYRTTDEKVIITCPIDGHGDFRITPNNHIRLKVNCPKCALKRSKWGKSDFIRSSKRHNNGLAVLYIIKCFNEKESFYKFGITSRSVKRRYAGVTAMPYNYEIVYETKNNPSIVYEMEKEIRDKLCEYLYKPSIFFKGHTECFDDLKPVLGILKQLSRM